MIRFLIRLWNIFVTEDLIKQILKPKMKGNKNEKPQKQHAKILSGNIYFYFDFRIFNYGIRL